VEAHWALSVCWVCVARFWQRGVFRGGFHAELLEASPMSDGANATTGSKTDPPLAKAKPISDGVAPVG